MSRCEDCNIPLREDICSNCEEGLYIDTYQRDVICDFCASSLNNPRPRIEDYVALGTICDKCYEDD